MRRRGGAAIVGLAAVALAGCGEDSRAERPAWRSKLTADVPRVVRESQVADCDRGPVTIGSGPPDWRRRSLQAGPLGVFRRPLASMSETRNGQLITKMPVIVEGSTPVTLSVPPRQRGRVFLYYGRFRDRAGRPTTAIGGAHGFSEVLFKPCQNKPRTAWPGGIRVRGRRAVRLLVSVEGGAAEIPLRLGRPRPYGSR